ncbi:MAG: DUF4270 family protein [Paludibacteraceae bacterium]|nr:DUF4270 family protein [Paludibacteraceae bacterium]
MKKIVYLFILTVFLGACKSDLISTGTSVLTEEDAIVVSVDTFGVKSKLLEGEYIYSYVPDSMLLGECDTRFGTIHADILTQLACPEGYRYEDNAELDSVILLVSYSSWFGDGKSPMSISIFEIDKQSLVYTQAYKSNINPDDYCSRTDTTVVAERSRIIVPSSNTDSVASMGYVIRFRANTDWAERFFRKQDFSSQEAYAEQMKGLYLTSGFGSANLLHVTNVIAVVYYHYTYDRLGNDTTVSNERWFYANPEVRSVNRIVYTDIPFEYLSSQEDSVSYIVSPASMYTALSIPIHAMADTILLKEQMEGKRPYVNMARLKIDVLNVYTGQTSQKTADNWGQPATYMLLLKQSAADSFFTRSGLPDDTCAILSNLTEGIDSLGNTIYYYSYDLSAMLTNQLRQKDNTDTLHMYLLPVSVDFTSASTSSSGTTVRAVHQRNTVSVTEIRSAQNKSNPMQLEVVCSGF